MSKSVKVRCSHLATKLDRRARFALMTLIICVTSIVLLKHNPATSGLYPPSPFRAFTGLYCPGCGTLRSLHQLLNGHLVTAFGLNPLMIISLPFLACSYLNYGWKAFTGKNLLNIFVPSQWIWFLLQAIIAYWIVRNIPLVPFSWLAP